MDLPLLSALFIGFSLTLYVEFVNSIWPTSMLSFGPPKRPKSLPTAFLFSVAAAEAEPCAALFAARKGEA